ncbi:hypothetical protein ACHHYP_01777 [Achlya hypogyna]|uniref:Uncharacterized protein n=1 Tax=Achlya hypogyna TaxID=1202772 RepID=A0A1V9ZT80_ACHHY|nr:hypothetical protein ACHHYP_01777 [Achlya hypogyna]
MRTSMEKGRVEKKGRFTIIDLPAETGSSASFHHDAPLSPSIGSPADAKMDDAEVDAPLKKTRIEQKGRFTIIDLHPTTPSPERTLHKVLELHDVADSKDAWRPVKSSPSVVAVPARPPPVRPPHMAHAASCCHHRVAVVHPDSVVGTTPLCTLALPVDPSAPPVPASSPVVVIPAQQYQQQQAQLATLQKENRELQSMMETLQDQQRQLFELIKSFQKQR